MRVILCLFRDKAVGKFGKRISGSAFHGNGELYILAVELLRALGICLFVTVVGREGEIQNDLFTYFFTHKSVFKSVDKLIRAELQLIVCAAAAGKGFPVHFSFKIDLGHVAVFQDVAFLKGFFFGCFFLKGGLCLRKLLLNLLTAYGDLRNVCGVR